MSNFWLKAIALLGALACTFPAWPMEGSDKNRILLAQPTLCSRTWLAEYCPSGCAEAADCREAMIDHRLEESDCMSSPVQASEKIERGCGGCNQVFCRR